MSEPSFPPEIPQTVPGALPAPEPRRRPSTFGGLIYLLVGAATVFGLGLVAFGPWRRGIAVVGVALMFAAGMRLVVTEGEAGMLRVRSRWFDVAAMAGVGAALVVLASNIPDQPGL